MTSPNLAALFRFRFERHLATFCNCLPLSTILNTISGVLSPPMCIL
jgi:hypothetical protein